MKLNTIAVKTVFTLIMVMSLTTETKSGVSNRDILVGASARAIGMGSAFTAGPASGDSFYWNASSLGFLNGMELSVVGLPFAENLTNREGAFSLGLNPQRLGIFDRKIGNISFASWFEGWGADRERNRTMLLGYGYAFGKSVAAGVNVRHHRRSRNLDAHLGWSYDFGIQVSRRLTRFGDRIAFGLSLEDLDGRLRRDGQLIRDLPLVVRFGTAYHFGWGTILSSDFTLHNDDLMAWKDRFRAHLGVEKWLFNRRLGIRFGYTAITNDDRFTEGEWSRGFSFRSDTGRFDYAYLNGGEFDEGSHWIAATFRWDGIPSAAATAPPEPPAPILMPDPAPPPPKTIPPVTVLNEDETDFNVSERAISPNGDGVQDIASFNLTVPENAKWTLEIRDERGETVKRYSGTGLREEALMWNGQNEAGKLVNDGTYSAQFTALDLQDYPYSQRHATVEVDTVPTDFKIRAEPLLIESSSEADAEAKLSATRITNTPVIHVQTPDLDRIARWELKMVASGGDVIDSLDGDRPLSNTIAWNSRERPLVVNRSEDYHFEMTLHDLAGNHSFQTTSLQFIDLSLRKMPIKEVKVEDTARQEEPVSEETPPPRHEAPKREQGDSKIVLTLPGIAFDTGSYEINDDYSGVLDEVAEALLKHSESHASIEGHTDSIGDADYNLELSFQRADAVKRYLVEEFGISPARLAIIGYGEEKPIADNDVESMRHQNRRVEVVLFIPASSNPSADEISEIDKHATAASGEMSESDEKAGQKWALVVSSFKTRKNAELLVENLETLDIADEIGLSRIVIDSETWYRVTVGRFNERHEALKLADELRDSQGIEPILISVK